MCIDIDIDLYGYCSVKFQFSSTYVWPNSADAWISHSCEHAFPFSFLHIVCRSSKVFIVIKATKAGAKPCRFRDKTFYVGKFSNGYEGPKVIVRSLINLPEFLWPQTDLRIADLENTDLGSAPLWTISFVFFPWSCQPLCYEIAGLMSRVRTQTSVSTAVFNASYLLFLSPTGLPPQFL